MKKFLLCSIFLLLLTPCISQNDADIDAMLVNIDKSKLTSGVLYERTTPWAGIYSFNTAANISSKNHFEQALMELYVASDNQKFITPQALRSSYLSEEIEDAVDIGIINAKYHFLNYNKENEQDGSLRITDNIFEKINNDDPFIEDNILIVAPLKEYLRGNTITYNFDNIFLFEENSSKSMNTLIANFDTGTDYTVFQNGNFINQPVTINYSEEGHKILTFTATFSDGSVTTTQSTLHVKLLSQPLPDGVEDKVGFLGDIPFQGYDETTAIVGQLDYRIFYADNNNQELLLKPIILIDGFDPGDKRKIEDQDSNLPENEHMSIRDMTVYFNSSGTKIDIINELTADNYDVIVVNHPTYERGNKTIDGGADYIERNALTHVTLYQDINAKLAQNGSNEQLAIVGPSMGGQISRYALAYMEANGIPHNTRLWISVDSPHLGANIPLGLQAVLNQAKEADNVSATGFVNDQLGSPAAKQQLIEQYNGYSSNQLHLSYLNAKTIGQGFSENRGHPFFITFYNNLYSNGLPNSRGYPQNLRKIALVNGSLMGNDNYYNPFSEQADQFFNNGQIGINIRGFQEVCHPIFPICFPVHIASLEAYAMPAVNSNGEVSRFKKLFDDRSKYVTNINSRGNMDNISGGWFNGFQQLANDADGTNPSEYPDFTGGFWADLDDFRSAFTSELLGGAELTVYDNESVHSFIPTISSLGFINPDFNWTQNLSRDLVCTGEIPFDTYYGPRNNEQHTFFTEESKNWLFEELAGNEQPPTVYVTENDLVGPDQLCFNDIGTYDFGPCGASVQSWAVSSNLTILTSNDKEVTVQSQTSTSNAGTVTAILMDGTELDKEVWLGTPGNPGYLNGPELVLSGAIVSYSGGVSEGADSYEWSLPTPFNVVNPIDYFSDNWQTYPNMGRTNGSVFTGYGEHNGRVELRGVNECGNGGVAFVDVQHDSGGGGGIPVVPFPNSTDDSFTLDFSSLPEANYQITIYDMNSTIMYDGESTNVEKMISTWNIPNGTYYLHISEGNKLQMFQLLVEH